MNLGKLLGAGKTFFGGKGEVAYRQNKKVYLPKFNAEKNPFITKLGEPAPVSSPVMPLAKKVSVSSAAPVAPKVQKISQTPAARPTRAVSWTDKLNPFRSPEPMSLSGMNEEQVELSLDAVRPVGNDLADADIEVVPVKSRGGVSVTAPMLPPAREAWEFLGERLIKAD